MKTLLWSVRRELWEHRWVFIVPAVAGGVIVAVLGSTLLLAASNSAGISAAFNLAARMLLIMGTLSTFVYCAEALHAERRDGSIVFWKALPVADRTTVLGKAAVALVVIPVLTLGTLLVAQGIALTASLKTNVPLTGLLVNPWDAALEVVASALWIAPVYAWVLLVSAWARRAVLLMAFLPAFVITIVEAMLTRHHVVGLQLFTRGVGRHWPLSAPPDGLRQVPARELLASWNLWAGVIVAVLFLATAIKIRRRSLMRP